MNYELTTTDDIIANGTSLIARGAGKAEANMVNLGLLRTIAAEDDKMMTLVFVARLDG